MSQTSEFRDDPALSPAEKEVTIRVARDQDRLSVRSEITGVTRRLVSHPLFGLRDSRHDDGAVVMVEGTLPLGVLLLRQSARQHGTHADIVTAEVHHE
jgi:hypothetical protein